MPDARRGVAGVGQTESLIEIPEVAQHAGPRAELSHLAVLQRGEIAPERSALALRDGEFLETRETPVDDGAAGARHRHDPLPEARDLIRGIVRAAARAPQLMQQVVEF